MKHEEIPIVRVYLAAYAILLMSIALLVMAIVWNTQTAKMEIQEIKKILFNDYEYVDQTSQQENGENSNP